MNRKNNFKESALFGKQKLTQREKMLTMATIAILAALSIVMILTIPAIPIFPAVSFMRYDMADVPILVGSLLLGPVPGMIILVITSAIQAFALGMDGIIGFTMHVLASGTLLLIPSIIYRRKPTFGRLVIGLILGTIGMATVMAGWNLLITPLYTGWPVSAVLELLVPFIIPFNLIKAGLNSMITGVVFYSLKPLKSKIFRLNEKKSGQHA